MTANLFSCLSLPLIRWAPPLSSLSLPSLSQPLCPHVGLTDEVPATAGNQEIVVGEGRPRDGRQCRGGCGECNTKICGLVVKQPAQQKSWRRKALRGQGGGQDALRNPSSLVVCPSTAWPGMGVQLGPRAVAAWPSPNGGRG